MSHYCAKCRNPLLGGSHICPTCGFDNALGALPNAPAPESPGTAPAAAPAPHHAHPLEFGTIAPLSTRKNWGVRIGLAVLGLAVIGGAGYGWWSWRAKQQASKITWTSPPVAQRGLPTAGIDFSCALTSSGTILCWGSNEQGQLGDTIPLRTGDPCEVRHPARFTQLDAGDSHVCARNENGEIFCWGGNARGQLGVATQTECSTSHGKVACSVLPMSAPTIGALAVSAGAEHSCALNSDSTLTCWGSNYRGQLGVPRIAYSTMVAHPAPRTRFQAVVAGGYHTCALALDGTVMCWGWNRFGQLGVPGLTETCGPTSLSRVACSTRPVAAAGTLRFTSITAGREHTCGIATDGATWCWGANDRGQLGTAATADSSAAAIAVAGAPRFQAIAAGQSFTCGLTAEGAVWCWGDASAHQLASADSTFSRSPVPIALTEPAKSLGAGAQHACVVTAADHVLCWGAGAEGQSGAGRVEGHPRLHEAGPPTRAR